MPTKRKYQFDEKYFDIIDTFDKSYWLGFLVADGSVRNRSLRLELSNKEIGYKKGYIIKRVRPNQLVYELHFGGNKQFKDSSDSNRLTRKYNLYLNAKSEYNSRKITVPQPPK